jgi:hypothetical protein
MRLFISYAHVNKTTVEQLASLLEKAGHHVWYDYEITGGDDWWQTILTEIEAADVFIFALSPQSTNSEACKTEFQYALDLKKPLLPVMLKQGELPAGQKLYQTQYIDGTRITETDTVLALNKALNQFQERIDKGEFPAPEPKPARPAFPFPQDNFAKYKQIIATLHKTPQPDILQMIYELKQLAKSENNPKEAKQARELLRRLASSTEITVGTYKEATSALEQVQRPTNYLIWVAVAVVALVIVGIGAAILLSI